MVMISYAQNYEDVMLRRVFENQPRGLYIDVGAYDPVSCSITKHFYDKGWHGINIEPARASFDRVQHGRPRDINLNVGISDQIGKLTFYEFPKEAAGLNSFSENDAKEHLKRGYSFQTSHVDVTTLADVCSKYVNQTIDFMSVDVEGHEEQVLRGADWKQYRPRIIVIEATRPTTPEETHERWEYVLLNADYVFATFDGLNRFYVRKEEQELIPKLQIPPNVFDEFVPYSYHHEIEELRETVREYRSLTLGTLEPIRYLRKIIRAQWQSFRTHS
jgi:FkbM family methyltransferase